LEIEIYHSAYLFRSKQNGRKAFLEINEGFIHAPVQVKQAILEAALKRRTAKRLDAIKAYTAQPEYRKISAALQSNDGGNRLAGRGEHFDLCETFNKVNDRYFENKLPQPRLLWSSRKTTRRLGAYHPESDTITINRRLDSADIPAYLLEYVMYHEMLHKKIGLKEVNGRRYAHTKKFRDAEQRFESYTQAEALIKKLNQMNLF
jgi:predicted metal-dependent hydrolase